MRRAIRERVAVVETAVEADPALEWSELRSRIDEEIGRLPEHHRRAVVLCDIEGLSREEAALKLGWSLNMVRGRLERARDRLRSRLARRGLAPSGASMALMAKPPALSPALVAATTRAALAFSVGRMGAGLASASAVALTQGVLRMMMYSKLKVGLAVLLSTGFVAVGSGMLAAQGPGDAPRGRPRAEAPPTAREAPAEVGDLASLGRSRVEMARKRYQTQRALFERGETSYERPLNASQTWMDAERDADESQAGRLAAIRAHLDRIKEIEQLVTPRIAAGLATSLDVEEVQTRRLDAEFLLARESRASGGRSPVVDPTSDPRSRTGGRRLGVDARKQAADPFSNSPPANPRARMEDRSGRGGSSLARAVEDSNREAKELGFMWNQDPLTEEEVIAAIRHWQRPEGFSAPASLSDEFKRIAETRWLPAGTSIALISGTETTADFVFEGSWIRIRIRGTSGGDDVLFPIRERLTRSMTLVEAIARDESALRENANLDPAHRARLEVEIRDYQARIKRREEGRNLRMDLNTDRR